MESPNIYRCAILGLGNIACRYHLFDDSIGDLRHHTTHAQAIQFHPRFELVAGFDPEPIRRQEARDRFAIPVVERIETVLDARPDVVIVCIPPESQCEQVISLIAHPHLLAELRGLLLEKPVGVELADVEQLERQLTEARIPAIVNYFRRFLPEHIEAKRIIQSGTLGRLTKANCTYGKGVLTNGSHYFNLMQFWLGPVEAVELLESKPSLIPYDFENTYRIRFAGHPEANVCMESISSPTLRAGEIDMWFEKGRLRLVNGTEIIEWQTTLEQSSWDTHIALTPAPTRIPTNKNLSQKFVLDAFARWLDGEPCDICDSSLPEAIRTVRHLKKTPSLSHAV